MAHSLHDEPDLKRASASGDLLEQGSAGFLRPIGLQGRRLRIVEGVVTVAIVAIIAAAAWFTMPEAYDEAVQPPPSGLVNAPPPATTGRASTWSPPSGDGGYALNAGVNVIPVDGVDVSVTIPSQTGSSIWDPVGNIAISLVDQRSKAVEGIIYWARYISDGRDADGCRTWWELRDLFASPDRVVRHIVTSPGVVVRRGPQAVTIGGYPARYLELSVRSAPGCNPGYFLGWEQRNGPLWDRADVGDTLRAWIIDADTGCLLIWAESHADASQRVVDEIDDVVESIEIS